MKSATDVFSEWSQIGKDEGMETGHSPAVREILDAALLELSGRHFKAIDAGCGNGWVVRLLNNIPSCDEAIGVDGADSMIERAQTIDPQGKYILADLSTWNPESPIELVHSMEVLYYLEDIPKFLKRVHQHWLLADGVFAFGIDHYLENEDCHGWSEKVGVRMAMYSEIEWRKMVEGAGFKILRMFRAARTAEWAGTLSFILAKNH
ncbi:MAG: nodulation protein S NodS [Planctomycetaceae bacterium]|nr:nodulation protein S NodS [Planctomycetaceae bacterium]